MRRTLFLPATLLMLLIAFSFAPVDRADAHRSGCHRWHSCPSDNGSYVCGDLGYDSECPNRQQNPPAPLPQPTAVPPVSVPPATGRPGVDWRTYATDQSVQGYWQANGGLAVFGYAKTLPYNEGGRRAQIFERNRLEVHPENAPPYNVQIGLLGEERLIQIGRIWQNEPEAAAQAGCRFFAETGHNLCEPFLSYWRAHGLEFDRKRGKSEAESLALFGYPVSEAVQEAGADGGMRLTQWFQRARFEDHGDQGVLLGLLGNEVYGQP